MWKWLRYSGSKQQRPVKMSKILVIDDEQNRSEYSIRRTGEYENHQVDLAERWQYGVLELILQL